MSFHEKDPSLTEARDLRGLGGSSSGGSRGGGSKGSITSRENEYDNGEAGELPFWGVFVIIGVFASIFLGIHGRFCIVSCRQLWFNKPVQ
jgi:hypothetical protein